MQTTIFGKCVWQVAVLIGILIFSATGNAVPIERGAETGFSINAGIALHRMTKNQAYSTYDSVGPVLGIGYQRAFGRYFSINAAGRYSVENTSGAVSPYDEAEHIAGTLGFRLWMDHVFIGVHGGLYREVLRNGLGQETGGDAFGGGLEAGWEGKSGWFLQMEFDKANDVPVFGNSLVGLTGLIVTIGHRF